jgi:hypothetical protein
LSAGQIDPLKVAAALNMKNPKSVGNRVGQMKKKFGFPIACSSKAATSGAGHAGNSATSGPAVPKTSNKNRVKKPAAKKAPAKGGKKAKKDESEDDGEQEAEQEIEQEIEQEPVSGAEDEEATVSSPLAVKELKLSTPELEEAVFGKADPKEEGEEA